MYAPKHCLDGTALRALCPCQKAGAKDDGVGVPEVSEGKLGHALAPRIE